MRRCRQITFDALDTEIGEVSRGRIDATPAAIGAWVRRALKARGLSHPRLADDRAKARPALLPRPVRTRTPALDPVPTTTDQGSLRHARHSQMITLPASSRSYRGSHPTQAAAHQRPSGRSHSTRTDRSTITSPTTTRSRTQLSPGIHGDQYPDHRNRSPPTLTQAPVQISDSEAACVGTTPRGLEPPRGAGARSGAVNDVPARPGSGFPGGDNLLSCVRPR